MFNTLRISLNDNLLGQTSVPEIKAVMAHELGHFVLNHSLRRVALFGLMLCAAFALTQWMMRRLIDRYGSR
jgi:STE24 endopeptidase